MVTQTDFQGQAHLYSTLENDPEVKRFPFADEGTAFYVHRPAALRPAGAVELQRWRRDYVYYLTIDSEDAVVREVNAMTSRRPWVFDRVIGWVAASGGPKEANTVAVRRYVSLPGGLGLADWMFVPDGSPLIPVDYIPDGIAFYAFQKLAAVDGSEGAVSEGRFIVEPKVVVPNVVGR